MQHLRPFGKVDRSYEFWEGKMMMMNYATLVYYARIGARVSHGNCCRAMLKALELHDDETFNEYNRESVYLERLQEALNDIWSGLMDESAAKKAAFLGEEN